MVNHGSGSAVNCEVVEDTGEPRGPWLQTTRRVPTGQEVLYDYGQEYWYAHAEYERNATVFKWVLDAQ